MKVLVISAHPDDETLGCGGTLLKHKKEGDSLHWIIATSPHTPTWSEEIVTSKTLEIEAVSEAYGMETIHKLGFPAVKLDTIPLDDIIKAIGSPTSQIKPEIIYLIHGGDVHSDHRITFEATMSAVKSFNMGRSGVRRLLSFETISSTETGFQPSTSVFIPNVFVDISAYITNKLEIMELYKTEMQDDPLPRGLSAIRALARYRGASIGVKYAEAFMLIREII